MIFTVRLLETAAEINATEELQRAVWGDNGIAPGHVIITAAHNGGLAAGAYVGDQLAGFVWGFLGRDDRVHPPRLKHCSHMLGVLPAFRNAGIGEALKRFQFEFVRGQGLPLITWTYDPLLATNARLNIAKLGAVCHTYLQNTYGDPDEELNAGEATDRFQVDWWVSASMPAVDEATAVRYEIPGDFRSLLKTDPARAHAWRLQGREAFRTYFRDGYIVTGFDQAEGRTCYVLHRGKGSSSHAD